MILIKPQFEVGREHIGKGGIVSDERRVEAAVQARLSRFVDGPGDLRLVDFRCPRRSPGGDGNKETVAVFRQADTSAS